jgi:hypothetical protein
MVGTPPAWLSLCHLVPTSVSSWVWMETCWTCLSRSAHWAKPAACVGARGATTPRHEQNGKSSSSGWGQPELPSVGQRVPRASSTLAVLSDDKKAGGSHFTDQKCSPGFTRFPESAENPSKSKRYSLPRHPSRLRPRHSAGRRHSADAANEGPGRVSRASPHQLQLHLIYPQQSQQRASRAAELAIATNPTTLRPLGGKSELVLWVLRLCETPEH